MKLDVPGEPTVAQLRAIVARKDAAKIRTVNACGSVLRARGMEILAELPNVVELDVQMAKLDDKAMRAIARMATLERLDIRQNVVGLGVKGLRAIFTLPNVRDFACSDGLARGGLDALLASDFATRLAGLNVFMADLTDRHGIAIAKAKSLANLERLELSVNRLTGKTLAAIAASKTLARIVELSFGHMHVRDEVERLAKWAALPRLRRLGLRSTGAPSKSLAKLAKATSLVELDLSANGYGDADAEAIAAAFPTVRKLNLDWNRFEPAAGALLAKRTGLESLILSDPIAPGGLSDDGAIAIAESRAMASLRHLDLRQNAIHDDGAMALAKSPYLEKLESFDLRWNHIGKAGVRALGKRFGKRVNLFAQRDCE